MSESIHIAEIVTFQLKAGSDPTAFVYAARAIEPMLRASEDVVSRTLSRGEDGIWTDHIIWTSLAAATTAANAMMSDPIAAPMMQMIDPEHVQMRHAPILYQQI